MNPCRNVAALLKNFGIHYSTLTNELRPEIPGKRCNTILLKISFASLTLKSYSGEKVKFHKHYLLNDTSKVYVNNCDI